MDPKTLKAQQKENRKRARKSRRQGKILDAKKLRKEPFTITIILVLTVILLLFVIYPLVMVLAKAFATRSKIVVDGEKVFVDVFSLNAFRYLVTDQYWRPRLNSLIIGLIVAFFATLIGLLFAYVEVYVKFKTKVVTGLFKVVSLLPTISPPFLVAIARYRLFGNNGLIIIAPSASVKSRVVINAPIIRTIYNTNTNLNIAL